MKITTRLLKSKGACAEQVKLFAELFPKGVMPTEELCVQHAAAFDWVWAANNLLSAPAWAEYNKTCAKAFFAGWQHDQAERN